MEYQVMKVKANQTVRVVYGTHLTFVVQGNGRVLLCTSNILKLLWFLSKHGLRPTTEYLPCHVQCQTPNYG